MYVYIPAYTILSVVTYQYFISMVRVYYHNIKHCYIPLYNIAPTPSIVWLCVISASTKWQVRGSHVTMVLDRMYEKR